MTVQLTQVAPFPTELEQLVNACTYRPDWSVWLEHLVRDVDPHGTPLSEGLTLTILVRGVDTYDPSKPIAVRHLFPVPPATFIAASWQRWLFERFCDVERHEAMEFFQIAGDRPYVPNHGPGHDVYVVREYGNALDAATRFTGEIVGGAVERVTSVADDLQVSVRLPDGRFLSAIVPAAEVRTAWAAERLTS